MRSAAFLRSVFPLLPSVTRGLHMPIPAAPCAYVADAERHSAFVADMDAMQQLLGTTRARGQDVSTAAHAAANWAAIAIHRRHTGDTTGSEAAHTAATEVLAGIRDADADEPAGDGGGPVANAASSLVMVESFNSFLATGTLGKRPAASISDEVWLSGLISSAHEIGRCESLCRRRELSRESTLQSPALQHSGAALRRREAPCESRGFPDLCDVRFA